MNSTTVDDKFIDIEDVIRKKSPGLLKAIPNFLIKYLKKIIHEDGLNNIIEKFKHDDGLQFVANALDDLGTHYEAFGLENIPASGRFIFASNHPLGGLDGLVLINETGKIFPNVKFIVNDLLLNIENLKSIFVPVNKFGHQTINYARIIEDTYKSDDQILYFPAGLCSRKIKGKITDLKWQKSFITKAVKYQRDIIPVFFEAKNSNFFYNLSNFRKFLGVKANFELIFLVDEMYKQKQKQISITFGKPISYTKFDKTKSAEEWAQEVRSIVYNLKNV